MDNVLVINSGSSSVKYELFAMDSGRSLTAGQVERIGGKETPDHQVAMQHVFDVLDVAGVHAERDAHDLAAIGHRIVHGGERFSHPEIIDDRLVRDISELALLAPLHTAANLAGIEATRALLPDVPQVAVFDTTFHRTMPAYACEYALPRELASEHGIRRYGFHGTSHAYVAGRTAALLGKPLEELNIISLHLGNGASVAAIRGGMSIDTSMGMTPLEGLVMGTRCGDLDPAIPLLLRELTGRTREQVHDLMNHQSGLKGLCGESDMREVHRLVNEGDKNAVLALEMFCYRAKKYIGSYYAALGRVDAIVFTGGIGENDAEVRSRICGGLERLGIALDEERNGSAYVPRATLTGTAEGGEPPEERAIQKVDSEVAVLVIPTDEELEIARIALTCVRETEAREQALEFAAIGGDG